MRDSKLFRIVVWVALGIIPMIYAGLLVWSNQDPTGKLSDVPAAIVNEDAGATVATTDGTTSDVNLGSQLTTSLTTAESPAFDWSVLDASTAATELDEGEIYAILTIPAGFSAEATSSTASDPAASASSGKLEIRTDDAHNFIIGTVSKTVATAVADALSTEVRKDYLQGLYESFGTLGTQLGDAASGASDLASGASDLQTGTAELASGAGDLRDGTAKLASGASDLHDGTAKLASGASDLRSGASDLQSGSAGVASGAAKLSTGLGTLASGAQTVSSGASAALSGAQSLDTSLQSLEANWAVIPDAQREAIVTQLATGAQQLVGSAGSGTGLSALAAGASQVSTGATSAATNAKALTSGAKQAASGASSIVSGAAKLADGAATANAGAQTLATKLGSAESGASTLATKLGSAESGARQLADGATTLSGKLADGAAKVPAYTDAEAAARAAVASQPVLLDAVRDNAVSDYGAGLLPYFLSLGLWVGALATFMMRAPLDDRLLRRRSLPGALVALRSYWPAAALGLAQAVAAVILLRFWVGIPMVQLAGVAGIAALASLTFMAVNQGLVGLFGPPGRFIALLLVVLQLAAGGGTYPVQTAAPSFQAIHDWLPVTHSMDAFRTLVSGGDANVLPDVLVLLAWLVGGLALAVLGALRARRQEARGVVPDEALDVEALDVEPRPAS